ncbi:MAG: DUF4236 domain-containing protein [Porticoccaceae bacterium]
MALRFRKSFKLAPGVRMNLSGSGMSWSVGPRGASVGIGKRGTYLNTGIPGTGLSSRQKLSGSAAGQSRQSSSPTKTSMSISIGVSDDGTVSFQDNSGQPLPEHLVTAAKRQQGEAIRDLIQKKCDEINRAVDAVGELHLSTPSPRVKPTYVPRAFEVAEPVQPTRKRLGFIRSLFKNQREKAEAEYQKELAAHDDWLKNWRKQRDSFRESEKHRRHLIEERIYNDQTAMEQFLEETLQEIVWPRETNISTEILDGGRTIFIDADFPEIEDMPNKKAVVPSKGYRLSVKELSSTHVQKLYMQHVHGIAFRTIGEAFSALPNAEEIIFSGYSQRADKATGQVSDEYLLSVRVKRSAWEEIDFGNVDALDVVEVLPKFELRRTMTKTGVFKPIVPFAPQEQGVPGATSPQFQ